MQQSTLQSKYFPKASPVKAPPRYSALRPAAPRPGPPRRVPPPSVVFDATPRPFP